MSVNSQLLRKIPKVDELLRLPELSELSCPHTILTESSVKPSTGYASRFCPANSLPWRQSSCAGRCSLWYTKKRP